MNQKALSIRPFIGAKDFEVSRSFYRDLGFQESILFHNMSYFKTQGLGFYLQDADVKDWIDNTMVFMEVENVDEYWKELLTIGLKSQIQKCNTNSNKKKRLGQRMFPARSVWNSVALWGVH